MKDLVNALLKGRTQKSCSRKWGIKSLQEFQPWLVSVTWLSSARLNKLSQDRTATRLTEKTFSSFSSAPATTHLLWEAASVTEWRWMIGSAQCKYQAGISKNWGDPVNPRKDTDRFVLHLIDIKREFRMTEQGDEWNVNTLVRYFGPTFPEFLIFSSGMFSIALLQWSLTSSGPRQTEQHFWWHLIYSHKTYYSTYTVNLNFCCWCVTARESTFSSSAWVPEVLLPSLLSEKTSPKYKFNDLTGATVQLLLLSSSSVYAFHPQLQIAQGI